MIDSLVKKLDGRGATPNTILMIAEAVDVLTIRERQLLGEIEHISELLLKTVIAQTKHDERLDELERLNSA